MPTKFTALVVGLHVLFLTWVVAAAAQLMSGTTKYYAIASLLGLSAYTLMWLHYVVGWIHDRWWPEVSLRTYMKTTSRIVLGLILLHPILLITIFYMMGLGLPPASYTAYAGQDVLFVYVGVVALVSFLLYETRRKLYGKPVWSLIAMLSHMAMLMILVHGVKLGLVLHSQPLLKVLWVIYAVGLVALFIRMARTEAFRADLRTIWSKATLALPFVLMLIVTAGVVLYGLVSLLPKSSSSSTTVGKVPTTSSNSSESSSRESSQKVVSSAELAANDGKNGNNCWVAVDSIVYQIVSDEWVNGRHLRSNLAYCGADMSKVIRESPHGKSVLGDQTVIGTYSAS